MPMYFRLIGVLIALLPALAGFAQDPTALYTDPDPAAVAFHPPPGGKAQFRTALGQQIQRNPKNATALAHRAYLFQQAGDQARARRDYDAALAAASGMPVERRVLWSRGWSNFLSGDTDAAIVDWQRAQRLHGGHPYWAAYTYSLAYGALGQMDQALLWYDAAVRSNPEWGTRSGLAQRTRHWKPNERSVIGMVFVAWQAAHPDWMPPPTPGS